MYRSGVLQYEGVIYRWFEAHIAFELVAVCAFDGEQEEQTSVSLFVRL